jgi:hypothetical protein
MSWRQDLHEHVFRQYSQRPLPVSHAPSAEPTGYWTRQAMAVVQSVERIVAVYVSGKLNKQEFIEYLNKFGVPTLIQCEVIEFAEESIKPRRDSKRSN